MLQHLCTYRVTYKGCEFKDECKAFIQSAPPSFLLDLRSFRSSLKSHPLWVTLCIYLLYPKTWTLSTFHLKWIFFTGKSLFFKLIFWSIMIIQRQPDHNIFIHFSCFFDNFFFVFLLLQQFIWFLYFPRQLFTRKKLRIAHDRCVSWIVWFNG